MSSLPQHPLSRRQVLQGGLGLLAAQAALSTPVLAAPAGPTPLDPAWQHPAPPLGVPAPRGMAAVTSVLYGVGVYVGNDWFDWDDTSRRWAMAKVRTWGFDFICPKVGGYGRTWYRDTGHLRHWAESARGVGLGFVPFIYTIPDTGADDAKIAAEMANTVGIACVDMEDEWGAHEKDDTPGYKGAQMAEFGRIYRDLAGPRPIIVTGYGDPVTRFGKDIDGFPNSEMAAWMDAYSPQWYIGVYSRYHKGGVKAALDWGKDEVRQVLGPDCPIAPSIDLSCSYTPDNLFPINDTLTLMADMRTYNAPIFVWEYGMMTPAHAEALLGTPSVNNLRVGRVHQTSFDISWDSHVPSRSQFSQGAVGITPTATTGTSLALTHTEGAGKLTPGTPYLVSAQSVSGGGQSPSVPLTVCTAPATPGIYAQSASAVHSLEGHITVTVMLANSTAADIAGVQLTSLSADNSSVLSPTALPYSVGTIAMRDRTAVSLIVSPPKNGASLVLHLSGTAAGQPPWSATLPVSIG